MNKYCLVHCEQYLYRDLLDEDKRARLEYNRKNHQGTLRRRKLRLQQLKLTTKVKEK